MRSTQLEAFIAVSPIQRRPITEAVESFATSLPAGTKTLDAGAGQAPYRSTFAHCEYRTQDWPASVHDGEQPHDIVCDLHEIDAPDAEFEAVLLTEVLEHVEDPGRVLTELARVTRPGGKLLLTVPFVGELHEEPHDYYRYTSHGLTALLEGAGWQEVEVQPLTGWFLMLAHMLRHEQNSTASPDIRSTVPERALSALLRCVSAVLVRIGPRLDRRVDRRRALPLGWAATATRSSS